MFIYRFGIEYKMPVSSLRSSVPGIGEFRKVKKISNNESVTGLVLEKHPDPLYRDASSACGPSSSACR
jgi:hypothetical protein